MGYTQPRPRRRACACRRRSLVSAQRKFSPSRGYSVTESQPDQPAKDNLAEWAAFPAWVRFRGMLMWRGDLAVILIGDSLLLVLAAILRHFSLLALIYFQGPE